MCTLENSSNLIFSRPSETESSLIVRNDVVDLKMVLDTAGAQSLKNLGHGAEGDRAVIRVG